MKKKIEFWHMAAGWHIVVDGVPTNDGPYIFKTFARIRALFL